MKGLSLVRKGTTSELFALVTTVTRNFGIFPFAIKDGDVLLSIEYLSWSLFLTALLMLSSLYAFLDRPEIMTINLSTLLLCVIQFVSFSLTHIISLFWLVYNKNTLREGLRMGAEVEKMLHPFESFLNLSEITFFSIFIIALTLFDFNYHDMTQEGPFICIFLRHYFSAVMILAIAFNFSCSVNLSLRAFSNLNIKLSKSKDIDEITKFLKCYDKLVSIVDLISTIFNPQLLLILSSYFVQITTAVYYVMIVFEKLETEVILSIGFWVFIFAKTIHHLISTCYSTKTEAAEFNKILYRLTLDDKTGQLAQNPKVMLHFSNKRSVVFTACGFFNIDYTLASSMIAAATTYLVILIQMGGSEKQSKA